MVGAGGNHIARFQGQDIGHLGQQLGDMAIHVGGRKVVILRFVDPELHTLFVGLGQFVFGDDHRPHGAKGMPGFAEEETARQPTRRNIDKLGVAKDTIHRRLRADAAGRLADHHGQFRLEVKDGRFGGGEFNRIAVTDHRVG